MPRCIIKTAHPTRPYLDWSSVVDAPITLGMSLADLRRYIKEEYGDAGLRNLAQRLDRIEAKGTSSPLHDSAEETIRFNRAGRNESRLTMDQIVDYYCERRCLGEVPKGRSLNSG